MAKLLKPMIILLFVLSIAALGLGFQLFGQRENLKGRVTKLEGAAQKIARNMKYNGLNPQMLMDFASMDGQLSGISKAAANQYEELETTKGDLESTKETLTSAQTTLEQTKTELADSQSEMEGLQDETRRQKSEIADKSRSIETLKQARADMESQVEDLNRSVAAVQAKLRDREREYDDLLKEYTQMVRDIEGVGGPGIKLDPNISGNVLVARPEWNFVIVDLGRAAGLESQVQLLVHRDRELVGRIRITDVKDSLSIGEIMNDWEVTPVTAGDMVIPPSS